MLRGRGTISRRSKPASFELTVSPLSQAWRLGGLHRASRVPFRSSYFTAGLHLPVATLQRLTAHLYGRWTFPVIPSLRFVAHKGQGALPIRGRGRFAVGHSVFSRSCWHVSSPSPPNRTCNFHCIRLSKVWRSVVEVTLSIVILFPFAACGTTGSSKIPWTCC